ncbi:MAG: hypothetical protein LBM18_02570 [Oscillospiraceae bacterium]|jgi:hypothetical protein|nr:hypothetical protein [Oscillospiraceae bacterium]
MGNRARVLNHLRNLALLLLSVSAVVLLIMAMSDVLGPGAAESAPTGSLSSESSLFILPETILITDENGARYAAKYDYASRERVFAQLSTSLGEALGSASAPQALDEDGWRQALDKPGVFFNWPNPQPLELIAASGGASPGWSNSESLVRRLCLACSGGKVFLALETDFPGEYLRLATALSEGSFLGRLGSSGLTAGSFAFETDFAVSTLDPYFVFSDETLALPAASRISVPVNLNPLPLALSNFGMNERLSTNYNDGDGIVYVDGYKTLRLSSDGRASFSASNADGLTVASTTGSPTAFERLSAASALISATLGPVCGQAEIGFLGSEQSGEEHTLYFGYYVDGIPVRASEDVWCAKIEIFGSLIVRAELICWSFALESGTLTPFSEKYNAEISAGSGGVPRLFYESAVSSLDLVWYTEVVQ